MMIKCNLKNKKSNIFMLQSHIFYDCCNLSETDKIAISIN